MIDSAIYYYKLAETTTDIYTARSVYSSLRDINIEKGNYKVANEYAEKLIVIVDSIKTADRSKTLLEIQTKYDEQVLINENIKLQMKYDRVLRNVLVGFFAVVIIVSFIVYKYQLRIRKKEEELRRYTLQIRENNKQISLNQAQIAHLQEAFDEQQDVKKKREEIDQSLEALNFNLLNRNLYFTEQIISLVPDFKKLKKEPRTLTEIEIIKLKQHVNQYFDAYIDRIKAKIPSLTDGDLELCALIKLGIPIKDISIILNIDSASVSTRRYRMQKRILDSIGSFGPQKGMDDWLREQ